MLQFPLGPGHNPIQNRGENRDFGALKAGFSAVVGIDLKLKEDSEGGLKRRCEGKASWRRACSRPGKVPGNSKAKEDKIFRQGPCHRPARALAMVCPGSRGVGARALAQVTCCSSLPPGMASLPMLHDPGQGHSESGPVPGPSAPFFAPGPGVQKGRSAMPRGFPNSVFQEKWLYRCWFVEAFYSVVDSSGN